VTSESRVCNIRNWMSTPWLIASLMVLMMSGTMDCGTALSAINRWRDPSDIATTFAFLVAHPMNTGLSKSSDWGPSAMRQNST
jgi:hypothetical protein